MSRCPIPEGPSIQASPPVTAESMLRRCLQRACVIRWNSRISPLRLSVKCPLSFIPFSRSPFFSHAQREVVSTCPSPGRSLSWPRLRRLHKDRLRLSHAGFRVEERLSFPVIFLSDSSNSSLRPPASQTPAQIFIVHRRFAVVSERFLLS